MKNQEKMDRLFSDIMENTDNLTEAIRTNLSNGVTLGSLSTRYDIASAKLEFMFEIGSLDKDNYDVAIDEFIESQKDIQEEILKNISYRTDVRRVRATAILNLIRDIESIRTD